MHIILPCRPTIDNQVQGSVWKNPNVPWSFGPCRRYTFPTTRETFQCPRADLACYVKSVRTPRGKNSRGHFRHLTQQSPIYHEGWSTCVKGFHPFHLFFWWPKTVKMNSFQLFFSFIRCHLWNVFVPFRKTFGVCDPKVCSSPGHKPRTKVNPLFTDATPLISARHGMLLFPDWKEKRKTPTDVAHSKTKKLEI